MTAVSPSRPLDENSSQTARVDSIAGVSYVLPLRRTTLEPDHELARYLKMLATLVEVVVADGSPREVFAAHRLLWDSTIRQVPVTSRCLNGKVAGVVDGACAASNEALIIADDDVRYDRESLAAMAGLLVDHPLVRPQNYFTPLPWHARWDSARSLLNRALGDDYPGTLGVQRRALEKTGGYCGAVLFENLELIRTLQAHGFSQCRASDVFVRRLPPDARHFWGQRIRQAYDSRAQPARQLVELALAPLAAAALRARRPDLLVSAAGVCVGMAELGRRRGRAAGVFPWPVSWWAPVWVVERAICSWLALLARMRGGAVFGGARLRTAAHPSRTLIATGCPELVCSCHTGWRPTRSTPRRDAP